MRHSLSVDFNAYLASVERLINSRLPGKPTGVVLKLADISDMATER